MVIKLSLSMFQWIYNHALRLHGQDFSTQGSYALLHTVRLLHKKGTGLSI